jgi:hypothetical protein
MGSRGLIDAAGNVSWISFRDEGKGTKSDSYIPNLRNVRVPFCCSSIEGDMDE